MFWMLVVGWRFFYNYVGLLNNIFIINLGKFRMVIEMSSGCIVNCFIFLL